MSVGLTRLLMRSTDNNYPKTIVHARAFTYASRELHCTIDIHVCLFIHVIALGIFTTIKLSVAPSRQILAVHLSLICKFLSYDCDGRDPRKDAELLVVDKGDGGSRVRVG